MVGDYFKELDTPQYQAHFTVTENSGGVSQINISADNNTRLLITNVGVQMSNTAANRSTYIELYDSSYNLIYRHFNANIDNKFVCIPAQGTTSQADNNGNMQLSPIVNGDKFSVRAFTLAAGETYEVYIRGYIRGRVPNINSTGSTGSVSLTTNYARIQ